MAVEGKGQSQKGGAKPQGKKGGGFVKNHKGKAGADAGANKRGIKRKLSGGSSALQKQPGDKVDKSAPNEQSAAQNGHDIKGPANKVSNVQSTRRPRAISPLWSTNKLNQSTLVSTRLKAMPMKIVLRAFGPCRSVALGLNAPSRGRTSIW
jgi:hypothetical protein